ncbi:MAG: phage replisome organizer N-terminal domain-containing protein [Neisseriaceae bacterium]|nr:phage replisome organizer N-terminal domain-containing protein [Neisseriaceae bacterium]
MGKKYYWLKLKEDFFNNIRMKKLRRIAGGEIFTIIYLKMQLLSLQNEGALIYEGIEETFTDEIALKIDEDPENVKLTCIFLQNCGLIEQTDANTFVLTETVDCIGKESESAKRMRKLRGNSEVKRLETSQCDAGVTQMCANVRKCDIEKEIEKEKEIEIESNNTTCYMSTSVDAPKVKPADVVAIFHDICKSYPRVRAISESRKKAINARLRNHSVDEVKEVFEKAEHSAFLKGNNQRNWCANFDWLMKDTNFCKVLDGNYDNKNDQRNYSQQTQQEQPTRHREIDLDNLPF